MVDVLTFTIECKEAGLGFGNFYRPEVHLKESRTSFVVWTGSDEECWADQEDAIYYGKQAFARRLKELLG